MQLKRHVLMWLAAANLLGAAFFTFRTLQADWLTYIDAVAAVTQLDREGVINNDALGAFHPSFGFTTEGTANRYPLANYIAGPAVAGAKNNAALGIVATLCNALVFGSMAFAAKRPA